VIRLFRIGQTPVLCSPFAILPALYALLSGNPGTLLLNLFALFLHELSHTFAAKAMGFRIQQIELQPVGFVARLQKRIASRPDALAVAAAGPVFSLITGILACFAAEKLHAENGQHILQQFGQMNLFLGMFNLLPALPLDGGRMAESLFSVFCNQKTARKLFLWTGIATAASCTALGSFFFSKLHRDKGILLLVIGVFLALSVLREQKWQRGNAADLMLRRREQLHEGSFIPIRLIALHETTTCAEALFQTELRFYTIIYVVNDAMNISGIISEGELFAGIALKGQDIPLSALLKLR